jgi:hypothetical protein
MEYIFGFIIQIAGIMLLAKLSWSLLRLLARQSVRPLRFVLTQITEHSVISHIVAVDNYVVGRFHSIAFLT